jgi:hypothetical protein
MGIDEYRNDRSVRSMIDALLRTPDLPCDSSAEEFRKRVAEVDQKFRGLLLPGIAIGNGNWWEVGVPKYAGSELALDFGEQFGVMVEVV